MLIGEVEEEYVVCLAVDVLAYGVWLICDECGEYAIMPHAGDDVVPVGFAQVEMGFFSKQEDRFCGSVNVWFGCLLFSNAYGDGLHGHERAFRFQHLSLLFDKSRRSLSGCW
jgi:hypothetical protein